MNKGQVTPLPEPGAVETLDDARQRISALEAAQCALQRQLDDTLILNRVITAAAAALEPQSVLRVACVELAQAYGVPQAAIALLDAQGSHLVVSAEYCAPGYPSGLGERIPVADNPITQYVLDHRAPMVAEDVRHDERLGVIRDLMVRRGTASLLVAPIVVRNSVVGTLGLDSPQPRSFSAPEIALVQAVSLALSQVLDNAQLYAAVQKELAERKQAEAIISAQALTLAELSTPLIPVTDQILVLPLIGAIDTQRAQHILTALLDGITVHRATTVIVDITGIAAVDTHVATVLLQAAQAVELLGAQAILTGIRPEIAQTLVGLGVDLGTLRTRATVKSGIELALTHAA